MTTPAAPQSPGFDSIAHATPRISTRSVWYATVPAGAYFQVLGEVFRVRRQRAAGRYSQ